MTPTHPILLVDDEPEALTSMCITLRSAGFNNVRTCMDSRLVNGLLSAEPFSVMLLDLNMPHVSGHQVIREAAVLENGPPIVVVTASSQVKDYAQGAAAGIADYIVKPVDRDRLIAAVRNALTRPERQRGRFTREYLLSDLITTGAESAESPTAGGIIEMLDQSRREYRRLIAGLPMPYALLEPDTLRVHYCNDAFRRLLDADSRATAELEPFLAFLDEESRERTIRVLREAGELRDAELRGQTSSGRSFVVVGCLRQSREDRYIEAAFVDVTSHKKLEQTLSRASKLNAVGRMAAGLAHDFNNTLTVVMGYAELIASEPAASEAVRTFTGEIRVAVEKARRMVQQLLGMGASQRQEHVSVDLNRSVRLLEPSLRQHMRAGQSIALKLAAAEQKVTISADQIDHVVRNLVLNARDAMPHGGTITIATVAGPGVDGSASAILEIRDTGVGMDAATREKVFEPFFTTKPKGEGTGLGLSMVQLIVEGAGGSIHLASEPSRGTTFRIQLPSATHA